MLSIFKILIMLGIILVRLKPAFSRWAKSKRLPFKLDKHTLQASPIQVLQNAPNIFNKQMRKQDEKLKEQVKKLVESGLTEQQILSKYIKNQTNTTDPQGPSQDKQQAIDLAKQDLILNQIMSKYKNKKAELPIGSKYESQQITAEDKQFKEERILNKIRNHIYLNRNSLEKVTFEDQLKQKYSNDIINKAQEKRAKELSYFKDLMRDDIIKEHNDERSLPLMDRRLRKNQTYADLLQRDREETQQIKKSNKQLQQSNKSSSQLKKQQKESRRPVTKELVEFENDQYYKQKAIKQFSKRQSLNKEDLDLKIAGQKDMNEAADIHSIMVEEYEMDNQIEVDRKKQLYERSSFGRMDLKMIDLQNRLKKHGISLDIEQLKGVKKQMLFSQKKQRQQMQQYQKYLMKKEKKDKMKEYYKKIHSEKLREDLDFNIDFKNRFKDTEYDPLDIEGNLQKMKQRNLERQSTVVPEDVRSQIHFKKTEKNIQKVILGYIFKNLFNNPHQRAEYRIKQIKYNEKKTVAHIFWGLQGQSQYVDQKKIEQIQKKLDKSANYISGKMTQLLGLRYGPQIRFYYDRLLKQTIETKIELQKSRKQVIDFEIKNLVSKGHIKSQHQLIEAKNKLQMITNENLKNYNNRNQLLSKSYKKKQRQLASSSQVVHPRKSRKKSADERLWQHLDKL